MASIKAFDDIYRIQEFFIIKIVLLNFPTIFFRFKGTHWVQLNISMSYPAKQEHEMTVVTVYDFCFLGIAAIVPGLWPAQLIASIQVIISAAAWISVAFFDR